MTFDEYQKKALTTLIRHPDPIMNKTILVMGIAGEAGEVVEKWKKMLTYWDSELTEERKQELGKEMADVVWYIAVMAKELGLSFDDIMQQNIDKLASRVKRGTQRGAGDNR